MTATRATLLTAVALLEQAILIDRLSRSLTLMASVVLVVAPMFVATNVLLYVGAAIAVAIAGLVEMYLAVRLNFDAALFRQVATTTDPPDFAALDDALSTLGLLPPQKRGRDAAVRVAGAMRLMRLQAIALGAQVLIIASLGVALAIAD